MKSETAAVLRSIVARLAIGAAIGFVLSWILTAVLFGSTPDRRPDLWIANEVESWLLTQDPADAFAQRTALKAGFLDVSAYCDQQAALIPVGTTDPGQRARRKLLLGVRNAFRDNAACVVDP